jgi:hypothetical protein
MNDDEEGLCTQVEAFWTFVQLGAMILFLVLFYVTCDGVHDVMAEAHTRNL